MASTYRDDALRTPDTPHLKSPQATPMYSSSSTGIFFGRGIGALSYQTPETPKMPSSVHSDFIASILQNNEKRKSYKPSPQTPYAHTRHFQQTEFQDENCFSNENVDTNSAQALTEPLQELKPTTLQKPPQKYGTPYHKRSHTPRSTLKPLAKTPLALTPDFRPSTTKTPIFENTPVLKQNLYSSPAAFTPYRPSTDNSTSKLAFSKTPEPVTPQFSDADFHEPDMLELSSSFFDDLEFSAPPRQLDFHNEPNPTFIESFNSLLFQQENTTPFPAFTMQQLEALLFPYETRVISEHIRQLTEQNELEEYELFGTKYWRCSSQPKQ